MELSLTGRAALVTGSTQGIGAAIARGLGSAGAFVVVHGRDAERANRVAAQIDADGGRAAAVVADIDGGPDAVRALADAALEAAGGRLDILVNNAARLSVPTPTALVAADDVMASLRVNIAAPFLLTGILATRMAAAGSGAIINLGSISGFRGSAGSALYSMTKAAMHSLTMSWAAEYAGSGVRVNAVAPGPTHVEWMGDASGLPDSLLERMPAGRLGRPEEVANSVIWLASDLASHVHGAVLTVDGGYTAV
ncbi:SDR family oxidoreductase [Agromyces protaetiae]|uniref:SDR family oxidoreductase n=1 Tax=Agromyces protaetiae TaxID=2509455 RepID=A0A4P6FQ40_9MICO|nr:SDR family oxidoreductase [Agromyces protaetiae]QAY72638.1 SDR family oxidoreductase [Agromyces protaetiae]